MISLSFATFLKSNYDLHFTFDLQLDEEKKINDQDIAVQESERYLQEELSKEARLIKEKEEEARKVAVLLCLRFEILYLNLLNSLLQTRMSHDIFS